MIEKIIKKNLIYAGIEKPATATEIQVEILGLKNAIKQAEEMISRYEQVFAIQMLQNEENQNASQTKSDSKAQESSGKKEPDE